jgi:hypothetical protein
MQDAVNFRWDKRKVRLISGSVTVVAAIGLFLLFQDDYGVKALGLAWIAALLFLAARILRRSQTSDPVVVVDARGIRDSRIADHIILWKDIRAVDTLDAENLTFVGIDLKPNAAILAHLRAMPRTMLRPNRILHFPSLSIAMHALDGTTADLLAAVARFQPDLIREH